MLINSLMGSRPDFKPSMMMGRSGEISRMASMARAMRVVYF